MKEVGNTPLLARFTTELLRVRGAATGGLDAIAYEVASQKLKEIEFQQWCSSCTGTVRIQLKRLPEGVVAVGDELSSVESAAHRKARAGTRYGLRRLAARSPGKTLLVGIEQGREVLDFRNFLRWIDKFELGDFGAYNGNVVPPTGDDPRCKLVLAAVVPAFCALFGK
jgi:hypothetical protein